jgi:Ni,Fe-hydrogenase III small subunit/Pyruvate/2-oxoacid:ferredoxin oxidoreductase delta subunit
MLPLLSYLINKGVSTTKVVPATLSADVRGLPSVTAERCRQGCDSCVSNCPTGAITSCGDTVSVDLGRCIGCGDCVDLCVSGTLTNGLSTDTWTYKREDMIVSGAAVLSRTAAGGGVFSRSLAIRVVSTGCSACDLEVSAANNPDYDMERFGVHVVASPRFADALLVTGPVPRAMHDALLSCYDAMAAPKLVIACGTCAISGGVHAHGYAEANGAAAILPVDVFIPGCPPHPWQIIRGIQAATKLRLGSE